MEGGMHINRVRSCTPSVLDGSGAGEPCVSASCSFLTADRVRAALARLHASLTDGTARERSCSGEKRRLETIAAHTCGRTSEGVVGVFNPRELGTPGDGVTSSDTPQRCLRVLVGSLCLK